MENKKCINYMEYVLVGDYYWKRQEMCSRETPKI